MPLDAHQNSGIDLQNLRTTAADENRAVFGLSYVLLKPKPIPVKELRVAPFVFPVSFLLSVTVTVPVPVPVPAPAPAPAPAPTHGI